MRDLWPESAVALGELSSPRAIAWAGKLEELCYNRASRIVVVTEGIRQRLIERGFPAGKLALIPNGANVDLFQRRPDLGQHFRAVHGLAPEAFVAVYAGIHGIAQGLETLLRAAVDLRNDPAVRFVFVGEGPAKAELQTLRAKLDLDNVLMLPEQPRSVMPAILSAPLLLSIDGEARRTLESAQGGLYVPPEDPHALAEAIRALAAQPDRGRSLGQNGRRYTEQHHSRQAQARQLEILLKETG